MKKYPAFKFQIPRPPDPVPQPPQLQLYDKPEDQILLHGEMIRDAATITEILQGLPFADDAYRGNLRVIIAANLRMRDVCLALLGEKEPEPDPEASNIIDESEPASTLIDTPKRKYTKRVAAAEPGPKNGRAPKAAKPAAAAEPVGRKAEVLQFLRKKAMTSAELIQALEPKGASPQTVYATLTSLRTEGLVDTRNDPLDGERRNFIK